MTGLTPGVQKDLNTLLGDFAYAAAGERIVCLAELKRAGPCIRALAPGYRPFCIAFPSPEARAAFRKTAGASVEHFYRLTGISVVFEEFEGATLKDPERLGLRI